MRSRIIALVLTASILGAAGCGVCSEPMRRNSVACVVIRSVVDCTTDSVVSVLPQFLPIVLALVQSLTGADGTVDWDRLGQAFLALGIRDGICILTAIENQYLSETQKPQASPYALRRLETYRAGLRDFREQRWPGVRTTREAGR
jgi:hypothetical protein